MDVRRGEWAAGLCFRGGSLDHVEDFDQYMLLLQGLIAPGMSGGGAFTEDGVFVGILCGGDEEGKVAVVPYSMIETERP